MCKNPSTFPFQHVSRIFRQSIIVGSIDGNEATPLSKFRGPRRSSTNLPQLEESEHAKAELVHQLRMELHLKEADNKFLQGELDKANDQITAKDNMLNMLTEGLKEVISLSLTLSMILFFSRLRSIKPTYSLLTTP